MITRQTIIAEAVEKNPKAAEIMLKYGLHCIGCHISPFETIEQGAMVHGISDEDIDKMVGEMNLPAKVKKVVKKQKVKKKKK